MDARRGGATPPGPLDVQGPLDVRGLLDVRGPLGFDVVVVGAGSAGATMAARLSEDPSRRVLLLEAGPDYRADETPAAVRGGDFVRALGLRRFHWPTLLARLNDDQPPRSYAAGRGVGGSSVINGQSAIRGLPGDFDRWAARGCRNWSWAEVCPSFRRLEHDLDFGHEPFHGTAGPLPVSRVAEDLWNRASRALAAAAADRGHPVHPDLNAPSSRGVSPVAWNRRDGIRVSTKDAYIEPIRGRTNLRVMADTLAVRARFHHRRCTGVEVSTPDGPAVVGSDHVVLCAGALHSPAFLLRSGIGPSDALQAAGIAVIADLPGVGGNLQDHPTIWVQFPVTAAAPAPPPNGLPGCCAVRFSSRGDHVGGELSDDIGHQVGVDVGDDLQIYATERRGSTGASGAVMVALMAPLSKGRVRLRSTDACDAPDIAFAMLSEDADVTRLAEGLREAMIALEHRAFRSIIDGPPHLPSGLAAADLDWDDAAGVLRANCTSYNHATGTCRMGPASDANAVVDDRGSVFGVTGVSVADASVMPQIVRAPTHLTTVMIAEHLAHILCSAGGQNSRHSSCELPEAASTPSRDQMRA